MISKLYSLQKNRRDRIQWQYPSLFFTINLNKANPKIFVLIGNINKCIFPKRMILGVTIHLHSKKYMKYFRQANIYSRNPMYMNLCDP